MQSYVEGGRGIDERRGSNVITKVVAGMIQPQTKEASSLQKL